MLASSHVCPQPTATVANPFASRAPRKPPANHSTHQEGGASSLSSVATLCNSAVGAGVLSLPFAFRCAGLAGGLLLCLLVAATESFAL